MRFRGAGRILALAALLGLVGLLLYQTVVTPRQDRARWARELHSCATLEGYDTFRIRDCLVQDYGWWPRHAFLAGAGVAFDYHGRRLPDYARIAVDAHAVDPLPEQAEEPAARPPEAGEPPVLPAESIPGK